MPDRWFIVADDLTGAADSATAFARRGLHTQLLLRDAGSLDTDPAVLACDADTRRMTWADAAAAHRSAVQRFGAPDAGTFKKIDSTLRGHLAIEIAAVFQSLADHGRAGFGVCAPAFPAMGRTTLGGRVFVHGSPLEESETWRREHSYASADLGQILSGAGLAAVKLPLTTIRQGATRLRDEFSRMARQPLPAGAGVVAICDAENDEDLDIIAGASCSASEQPFVIGTAGLAHAIARRVPTIVRAAVKVGSDTAGALVVVGSLSSVSRGAARELAAMRGVIHQRIRAQTLLDPQCAGLRIDARRDTAHALQAGSDVLLELVDDGEPDLAQAPRLARALAETFDAALYQLSGLAVTGGETAAALLSQALVQSIELIDEIEPGVTLGVAQGARRFPLVTKAGAFGDAGSLVRALEKLRMIRKSGLIP